MDLNDFDVEGPFGEGGLGEVLAATLKASGRKVVLKRPKTAEFGTYARTRDEGRLGLRLNGTAFVETLGQFDVAGLPYVALERIDGVTVFELWRKTGALSYPAVAKLGAEVSQALAVMHVLRDENGTPLGALHRDISCRNVMVDVTGRVRIIDLGAAFSHSADRSAVSKVGVVIGTLSYLPPEIFEGGDDTPARDMWCVGVMLLEAAIGNAFSKKRQGESTGEGLRRVRRKAEDPFSAPEVLALEPRLLGVLKQLLMKDPKLRMDAKTAAAELAALYAGSNPQAELARRVERARALPKPSPRPGAAVAQPPSVIGDAEARTEAEGSPAVSDEPTVSVADAQVFGSEPLGDDGPTMLDPPRRTAGEAQTVDSLAQRVWVPPTPLAQRDSEDAAVEDQETRRDDGRRQPEIAGGSGADGPTGLARPWPKAPPPAPVTEVTFLRALTLPESDGVVFEGVERTGPTVLGSVTPLVSQEDKTLVRVRHDGPTVIVRDRRGARSVPWASLVLIVAAFGMALWVLYSLF